MDTYAGEGNISNFLHLSPTVVTNHGQTVSVFLLKQNKSLQMGLNQ